ncbi:MAG: hypothetical protein C0524_17785 [Rhodobacter sp.]|nr:hypothetical protein [Rhodobacter sp.]
MPNSGYRLRHDFCHRTTPDAADALRTYSDCKAFLDRHGWHIETEMAQGQTEFPEGLYFAGNRPEWANLTLRQIFRDMLGDARKIGFLDIHTGLGQFGEIVYLIFAPEGSDGGEQALKWWNPQNPADGVFTAGHLPDYQGLPCCALEQELRRQGSPVRLSNLALRTPSACSGPTGWTAGCTSKVASTRTWHCYVPNTATAAPHGISRGVAWFSARDRRRLTGF